MQPGESRLDAGGNLTMIKCTHHICRCARAEELSQIADATGNGRYLREAIDCHYQFVPCRMAEKNYAIPGDAPGEEK